MLPEDRYPTLAAAAETYAVISWDDQFTFGLERLLDGIAAELERALAPLQAPVGHVARGTDDSSRHGAGVYEPGGGHSLGRP